MERVIYKNNGGLGLILTNESESDFILAEDVVLHGETLKPGDMTTIDGMFTAPMRYAGTIYHTNPETENYKGLLISAPGTRSRAICLHAGDEENLLVKQSFYYCLFYIDENTLVNKFTDSTARNFIWKDGKWK